MYQLYLNEALLKKEKKIKSQIVGPMSSTGSEGGSKALRGPLLVLFLISVLFQSQHALIMTVHWLVCDFKHPDFLNRFFYL